MANFFGRVLDKDTQQPVAGASVQIFNSNGAYAGTGTTSDSNGEYYLPITAAVPPNELRITSIGYKPFAWNFTGQPAGESDLEKQYSDLPGVTVTGNQKNFVLITAALLLAGAASKKKALSGVTAAKGNGLQTVLIVGAAAATFLGFDVVKKLFEGIGFWKGKDTKDVDQEAANPNSPFSPLFWKAAPAGALILTQYACNDALVNLRSSFGGFNDKEDQAIGIFKRFKTQSQVSYFSDYFSQNMNGSSMLDWLRGDAFPNDRLSDSEVNSIIAYVNNLPKYRP